MVSEVSEGMRKKTQVPMSRQPTRHERLESIVYRVQKNGYASVAELSDSLGVSKVTVRGDLDLLQREGRVIRTHGGAHPAPPNESVLSFSVRRRIRVVEKERIGAAAAVIVGDGEAIVLDASTTALHVARRLLDRHDLTVLTTGLHVALELLRSPGIQVLMPGGPVWNEAASIVGDWDSKVLTGGNFQRGFFGGRGLSLEEGLTDAHRSEADLKRRLVGAVREVNVILDGSKVGKVAFASCATLDQIHRLITTDDAPPSILDELRRAGVQVIVA